MATSGSGNPRDTVGWQRSPGYYGFRTLSAVVVGELAVNVPMCDNNMWCLHGTGSL